MPASHSRKAGILTARLSEYSLIHSSDHSSISPNILRGSFLSVFPIYPADTAAEAARRTAPVAQGSPTPGGSGSSAGSSNEVCVIKPKQFDESTEIVDALLDNCTVILNLEGLDITLAQHIIDFTAGASYAIDGNIKKVSSYIFILTPEGVDITGDSQEILNDIAGSASMYEGF